MNVIVTAFFIFVNLLAAAVRVAGTPFAEP